MRISLRLLLHNFAINTIQQNVRTYESVVDASEQDSGFLGDFGRGRVKRQNEGGVHIGVGADGPRGDLKTNTMLSISQEIKSVSDQTIGFHYVSLTKGVYVYHCM